MRKWTQDEVIQLIKAYKNEKSLWDHQYRHQYDFKSKVHRESSYLNIIRVLGIPGLKPNDIDAKMKYIRRKYLKQRQHILSSTKTDQDSFEEPRHIPTMSNYFWYDEVDKFLRESCDAQIIKKIGSENTADTDRAKEIIKTNDESSCSTSTHTCIEIDKDDFPSRSVSNAPIKSYKRPMKTNKAPKKIITKEQETVAMQRPPKINKAPKKILRKEEETEFDLFGRSVAMQLRKMPIFEALSLKQNLQALINQRRLELAQRSSATAIASPCVSSSNNIGKDFKVYESKKGDKFQTIDTITELEILDSDDEA